MLGLLGGLLGIPDAVTRAARGADRSRFADLFARSLLRVLSLPERFAAGLPASASPAEILTQVKEAAQVLSESTGFHPFSYVHNGKRRLPVFATEELAAEFAKWYALETGRIIPFQILGADGAVVVPAFAECDLVVLNDKTKFEYVLSAEDVALVSGASGLTTR